MKKFFFTLIAILLFLSCSNNDEIVAPVKLVLKLEQIETGSNDTDESNYQYDSKNRMIRVLDQNKNTVVSDVLYDNEGRLIKIVQPGNIYDVYEYKNGKLFKHTRTKNNQVSRIVEYTYKNNLVITEKKTSYYPSASSIKTYNYEYNGNTVKKTNIKYPKSYDIIKYDGKNWPHSGAEYLKKIFPFSSLGNKIETKSYDNGNLMSKITNTITYDQDNYPTKIIVIEGITTNNIWGETRIYTYNK